MKSLSPSRRLILTLAFAGVLAGCASTPKPVNVAETLARNKDLSTLNDLIDKAGLRSTLATSGPLTVFAPSNEAFKAVPAKTLEELAANPERLRQVLTYHVVANKVMAADVKVGPVKTLQGANLALSRAGQFVTVEDGMVTKADLNATNGVIHVVDRVLMPPAPARR
uniref:fasciclin domain-containing protein n=1 Tax=Hylemonella sp. TaxID=2066020 RepID=UPI0035B30C87